jgi:hypothetical protein
MRKNRRAKEECDKKEKCTYHRNILSHAVAKQWGRSIIGGRKNSMVSFEALKEQLSAVPLEVHCPNCHEKTQTGYNMWEKEVIKENPGIGAVLEFDCTSCEKHILYDPSIDGFTFNP